MLLGGCHICWLIDWYYSSTIINGNITFVSHQPESGEILNWYLLNCPQEVSRVVRRKCRRYLGSSVFLGSVVSLLLGGSYSCSSLWWVTALTKLNSLLHCVPIRSRPALRTTQYNVNLSISKFLLKKMLNLCYITC